MPTCPACGVKLATYDSSDPREATCKVCDKEGCSKCFPEYDDETSLATCADCCITRDRKELGIDL